MSAGIENLIIPSDEIIKKSQQLTATDVGSVIPETGGLLFEAMMRLLDRKVRILSVVMFLCLIINVCVCVCVCQMCMLTCTVVFLIRSCGTIV